MRDGILFGALMFVVSMVVLYIIDLLTNRSPVPR